MAEWAYIWIWREREIIITTIMIIAGEVSQVEKEMEKKQVWVNEKESLIRYEVALAFSMHI